ncbi:MAG: HAD-IB family phosphatase [Chloroflexota bacterium]
MPAAEAPPPLTADAAPVAVLVDYDGTISRHDIGDLLLDRHVTDRAALARLDAAYDAGTMGSRDLIRWDMDVLPDPPDGLIAEAAAVPQDAGFADLVRVTRARGGIVEIVSDGLGFYIESNLRRLGLDDVAIATNRNALRGGGAGVDFPYGHPACLVCGTCKRERVRAHQAAGRVVVFVGDGPSDRYAMHHADVAFATGRLLQFCRRAGYPAIAWTELREVAAWVEVALTDGTLPASAAEVPAWRAARRTATGGDTRPAFICGPEQWGPGRSVPPPPGDAPAIAIPARGPAGAPDGA